MSSPNDTFHDTSEQTPLLADTTAGQAQNEQGTHRSFLPSILPWRGLGHGHDRPPKPPSTPPRPDPDHQEAPPPSDGEPNDSTGDPNESEAGPADGPSDDNNNGQSSTSAADAAPTTGPWGDPVGLDMRRANDENVLLFREAIGIPTSSTRPTTPASELAHPPHHDDPESGGPSLDQSRKQATGIYARILREKKAKMWQASLLNGLLNACHVAQILVGAVLTTLGPSAQDHTVAITVLGATNTVLAGVFVLMKGQGLPDRLRRDALAFRRVQDWVEETDALLVAGVVGRDRHDVGLLVEEAFQKYNAVVANEQSNSWPDPTKQLPEAASGVAHGESNGLSSGGGTRGMAPVPAPIPVPAAATQEDLLLDVSTPGGDGGPGKSGPDVQAVSLGSSHGSEDLNHDGSTNGPSNVPGVLPVE